MGDFFEYRVGLHVQGWLGNVAHSPIFAVLFSLFGRKKNM